VLPRAHQPITGDGQQPQRGPADHLWPGPQRRHPCWHSRVPIIWFLLYRTTLGFEIRAAGANPDAARYGGMRTNRLIVLTMSIAGFMSGLAGSTTLSASSIRWRPGYDTTVGFDAITVALLGRSNPVGVLFAGVLLGAMRAGSQSMQIQAGSLPSSSTLSRQSSWCSW